MEINISEYLNVRLKFSRLFCPSTFFFFILNFWYSKIKAWQPCIYIIKEKSDIKLYKQDKLTAQQHIDSLLSKNWNRSFWYFEEFFDHVIVYANSHKALTYGTVSYIDYIDIRYFIKYQEEKITSTHLKKEKNLKCAGKFKSQLLPF